MNRFKAFKDIQVPDLKIVIFKGQTVKESSFKKSQWDHLVKLPAKFGKVIPAPKPKTAEPPGKK
jgi:hypothetical protein